MSKLVLTIDDSPTVCKVIEVCLHRAGYDCTCCASAEQAIEWLRSPRARVPDLILVDLLLPQMDGYSLIQYLHAQPVFSKTPFVVISRRSGFLDMLRGKLVGASDYLIKPFKVEVFLTVVQKYIGVAVSVRPF
jgi:CheY-like chemotaxis protein